MTCIYDLKKGPILKEIKGCEYQCTSTKQTAEVKKGEEVKLTSMDFIREFFIRVMKCVNEIFLVHDNYIDTFAMININIYLLYQIFYIIFT